MMKLMGRNSNMLSIGNFAKAAKVSSRTIRYYESIGLLPKSRRGENNYRYYEQKWLERMNRIRDLQSLGFSLDDIKMIIDFSDSELSTRLQEKLLELDQDFAHLEERRKRIQNLLSVANKIKTGEQITETERNLFMQNIRDEIIKGLHNRYQTTSNDLALDYMKRDGWLNHNPQIGIFFDGIRKCIEFAKNKKLTLGTPRGSAAASISLFGLGLSDVDPIKYKMIPERLATLSPSFHIDVEYERGQEFVDFCREINSTLAFGEIQAFKMPLIDIVQNTHKTINQIINYDAISDDSDVALNPFKKRDFEKIFQFDFTADSLIMNFERFKPEYSGPQKVTEHFNGQKEFNFRDIMNVTALWRPHTQEIIDRIELYKKAKAKHFSYKFLNEKIKNWLAPNYGVVIYHEDIIKIISEYTGWDMARSNSLRRLCMNKNAAQRQQSSDWFEFQKFVPKEIADFVAEESKWTFCYPHAISFAKFTKQTAVLKTLHQEAYFTEIEKFEQKMGFRWDDIGIRIKGVSLHQG